MRVPADQLNSEEQSHPGRQHNRQEPTPFEKRPQPIEEHINLTTGINQHPLRLPPVQESR